MQSVILGQLISYYQMQCTKDSCGVVDNVVLHAHLHAHLHLDNRTVHLMSRHTQE